MKTIKPINNVIKMTSFLSMYMEMLFPYSEETLDLIIESTQRCEELFSIGDYHYLPVYTDGVISDEMYYQMIAFKFSQNLHKYSYILDDINLADKSYLLTLNPKDKNTKTKDLRFKRDSTETDNKTVTTEEDNTITKVENLDSFQMTETSPINATINEITTPNSKNMYNNTKNNTQTDDKGKTETVDGTFTVDRTDTEGGTETDERVTIDMIDKYIELRHRTSFTNIIFNVYRTVIKEFNSYI